MASLWSEDEIEMVREMWTSGADDAVIARALTSAFGERSAQSVKSARARYGFVKDLPAVDPYGDHVSQYGLTHEQRVACDEAYVDAMIAAGYLPSDPVQKSDGKVLWRHQPQPRLFGNSLFV